MDFLLLNPQIAGGLVVAFMLLVIIKSLFFRPKLPQNKSFLCARCKASAPHTERTIEAWRKGIKKTILPSLPQAMVTVSASQSKLLFASP